MIHANNGNRDMLSVYLADDSIEDQQLFREALLKIEELTTLTVFDCGATLIEGLKPIDLRPDVIFLDLYMVTMDGEECLFNIRNDETLNEIPVVIYSNEFDVDRIEKLFELGANRYLRKPDSFKSLVASLDTIIHSFANKSIGQAAAIKILV